MSLLLDHSIVGQSLTTLTIRKDREFAACRICGAIYQSTINKETPDRAYTPLKEWIAHGQTLRWREDHNRNHPEKVHLAFRASGLTLTPWAAHRLAPFGLVPIADATDPEVAMAMLEAPRAPVDDAEETCKGLVYFAGGK